MCCCTANAHENKLSTSLAGSETFITQIFLRPQVREAIIGIFRERRNLAVQLKDTKSVVGRLKAVLLLLLHLLAAFFYLLIFSVSAQQDTEGTHRGLGVHL